MLRLRTGLMLRTRTGLMLRLRIGLDDPETILGTTGHGSYQNHTASLRAKDAQVD